MDDSRIARTADSSGSVIGSAPFVSHPESIRNEVLIVSTERIDAMRQFSEQFPDNPFPRYALALELKNAGRPDESLDTFRDLMKRLPDYVPAYLQCGMLLEEQSRFDEAREVVTTGIEKARAARDSHAQGELEGLLDKLS